MHKMSSACFEYVSGLNNRNCHFLYNTGDNENFGQRVLQSGDLVRQTYPGPVRSLALRSLPPHPGMPHPQFAIQHRPMSATYSEVPRHEVSIL